MLRMGLKPLVLFCFAVALLTTQSRAHAQEKKNLRIAFVSLSWNNQLPIRVAMQPILRDFLDKWVYPTGFTGPGVEFRLRQTERCLPLWDKLVTQAIEFAEKDLNSGSDEYKAVRARAGYAAEGPFMIAGTSDGSLLLIDDNGVREVVTGLPFVTLDPAASTDLDQAFTIERAGADLLLRYAIADVA